ncbi:heme exporter protein CcmD [Suttonella sp. R2A3]|uniref:heme exporter protein CcmD n=1 Tax=Suttonella sp. R2A3 TaxID=2908648 RepID=UPI001F18922F|nr:heme exporter protein CcmD [Suttonella sp. R2A3]UJF24740.1 heme exporter protein CcmD [Suttonella sp. R2A3]
MFFDSVSDFLAMGGHAPFVWSAYAITLFAIIGFHIHSRLRHRHLQRMLKNLKDKP